MDTATAVLAGVLAAAPVSAQRIAAPAWEALYLRHLRHLRHTHVSPSYIRAIITSVLDIFPASPAALAEISAQELHVSAQNRLRRYLDLAFQRGQNPLLWYLALRVENSNGRKQARGGKWEHDRWRATFERALAADLSTAGAESQDGADVCAIERPPLLMLAAGRGAQTPLLWRCYLGAELAVGRPTAARRVFLRAVNACPWDKALWLVGVRDLSSVFSARERSSLLDMIRTDMYEVQLERSLAGAV